MTLEMICIGCPMGCNLTVAGEVNNFTVSGQTCPIGDKYAREEITNPTRNIAASVRVNGGTMLMLSVKTAKPIPKNKIRAFMDILKPMTINAPVCIGDIIIENILDTGVDIVATRSVPESKPERII
jgi:CxxC motif-containing protein